MNAEPTRAQLLDDLVDLAAVLEDERIPLRSTVEISYCVLGEDDERGIAELRAIAEALGVEVTANERETQFHATKRIGSAVYTASYVTRRRMAEHDAFMAPYFDNGGEYPVPATEPAVDTPVLDEPRCDEADCGVVLQLIASGESAHTGRWCSGSLPAERLDEILDSTAEDEGPVCEHGDDCEDCESLRGMDAAIEVIASAAADGELDVRLPLGEAWEAAAVEHIRRGGNPPGCDSPRPPSLDGRGGCRCIVCARCGHHTGSQTQGHYWGFCKVTGTARGAHMCCPGDCELEAAAVASTSDSAS